MGAHPEEIERRGDREIGITWDDGHVSVYPNAELRFCARFIGSPPLQPSAMPMYMSPKSAAPGRAVGLNVTMPPL